MRYKVLMGWGHTISTKLNNLYFLSPLLLVKRWVCVCVYVCGRAFVHTWKLGMDIVQRDWICFHNKDKERRAKTNGRSCMMPDTRRSGSLGTMTKREKIMITYNVYRVTSNSIIGMQDQFHFHLCNIKEEGDPNTDSEWNYRGEAFSG